MIDEMDYSEELRVALEAAEKAGEVMDEYQQGSIEVAERKSGVNDIVTAADPECQEEIVETIRENFPEDGFIAEEEELTEEGDRQWVIDPIDGTSNFQKNFEYFCTSIALKKEGEYVLGVVHSPRSGLDETFFATEGSGAYRVRGIANVENAERIEVSDYGVLRGSMMNFGLSSKTEEKPERDVKFLKDMLDTEVTLRDPGAAALALCKLAEGSFDAFVDYVKEWDFAAGKVIVEEAGGVTRVQESVFEGFTEVVGSNGYLEGELEERVDRYYS
ncbi:MAG: inositol monophosphatase [Candidatus Nanosalina sp.]